MGAYHHLAHCLNSEALREKLMDYLPLGMEALIIPDVRPAQIEVNAITKRVPPT
jgi:hypothetical protein